MATPLPAYSRRRMLCMAAVIGVLLVLTGYRTQDRAEVPGPSEAIYRSKFFVDPRNQTGTVGESAARVGERAIGQTLRSEPVVLPAFLPPDTRLLVPGKDIALTDSAFIFLPNNLFVFQTRFKNITDDLNFHQPFFFTLTEDADTKNIVSIKAPLVIDADLGGDGVLSPGEETSRLSFEVIHKGEPFSFFVDAHAVVKAVEILAELIASAGHGKFFDKDMNEIKLTASLIAAIQDSIIDEILKASPTDPDPVVEEAQKLLNSQTLNIDETILIQSGVIGKLLQDAPEELITKFVWRNRALTSHYLGLHPGLIQQLRPAIRDVLERLGFFKPVGVPETDYMADCRTHRVPIPPDWAESGTPWVFQGALTQNLLAPGEFAAVWTYSDPTVRGACIALPRGTGDPGDVAGIICQSATTGHACFWDNKRRDDPNQVTLGWKGIRLVISELADGSNLMENCTGCHRGNNVFLISPDDPTWAKLLRGPLSGPSTGTFTTRVETSSDNRGGHPRYIPITTLPERPGWENPLPSGIGCAGGCHENHVTPGTPPMPPRCALPSTTDPSNCYGTP